jgi:ABC-2 type transport system ATP-binding protein
VFLDELTQGLDPAARRNVWAAIGQLRDEGATVVLVTHELDEAEALCDRVIAMRAGRVLDAGPPADLVNRHAKWATVRFSWSVADSTLAELSELDGVQSVQRVGERVEVRGDRRVIAYVGADLVRRGCVPDDLTVEVPDLESALLRLLEGAAA